MARRKALEDAGIPVPAPEPKADFTSVKWTGKNWPEVLKMLQKFQYLAHRRGAVLYIMGPTKEISVTPGKTIRLTKTSVKVV